MRVSSMPTIGVSALFILAVGCDLGAFQGAELDGDAGVLEQPDAQFVAECGTCHGDDQSPAPPRNLAGETDTSARGVGAHRSHLEAAPTWHAPVKCESCHVVPAETSSPGHIDGDNIAELTFTGQATGTSFDGTTCTSYCHGASLSGGALTQPNWTVVDGTQKACGNCHGAPPPPPHPESTDCGTCHPTMQPGTTDVFLDPASHINGVIDLADTADAACDSCHGSDTVSAPPKDLDGNTARAAPGVGAHREHLGTSTWRREITCSQCHQVPATVNAPGHLDGDNIAEVPFDTMNPQASYDPGTASCSGLYCHGDAWQTTATMTWTDDLTIGCGSCHAVNNNGPRMSGDHRRHIGEERMSCDECHDTVVSQGQTIIAPDLHIDGVHQVSITSGGTYNPGTRRCSNLACHGSETW